MKRRLFLRTAAGAMAIGLVTSFIGCSTITGLRGNTQYGADKHMEHQVQDALKKDPLYKFPDVSVNVYRDNVQLSGVVHLQGQKDAAVKDASSVPGVLNVQDTIMVSTNPPVAPTQ